MKPNRLQAEVEAALEMCSWTEQESRCKGSSAAHELRQTEGGFLGMVSHSLSKGQSPGESVE